MAHFLLGYWEFERDLLMLLDDMCITLWDRGWLDEFWQEDEEGKMALLLDKGVENICYRVMKDMGECVLYRLGRWWQRRKQLLYG